MWGHLVPYPWCTRFPTVGYFVPYPPILYIDWHRIASKAQLVCVDLIVPLRRKALLNCDDTFLNEFSDPGQSLELEPLNLEPAEPSSADKLEQAQTCIDDGDLDSAIELLNELLKEGNEPLKQTARNLLDGLS